MKNIFTKALILCLGLTVVAPASLHASQQNPWYTASKVLGTLTLGCVGFLVYNRKEINKISDHLKNMDKKAIPHNEDNVKIARAYQKQNQFVNEFRILTGFLAAASAGCYAVGSRSGTR